MRQALLIAQQATDKPDELYQSLQRASVIISGLPANMAPAEGSSIIFHDLANHFGIADPYLEEKEKYTRLALQLYPSMVDYVDHAADPLEAALRIAAQGNALDLSVIEGMDVDSLFTSLPEIEWAINDYSSFKEDVKAAQSILYLGDNAGEIVFDRVLVERLPKGKVSFVVKSGPVINDVTLQDAVQSGINQAAAILETGSNFAGVPLKRCSDEFLQAYSKADLIISKGQANFETLADEKRNIYFLLKVKCSHIAEYLGIRIGDIVLKKQLR